MTDYFPLTLAGKPAFCNRTQETAFLLNNIAKARPTLVMSPRRYGKSSLVHHAMKKAKVCYAHVDFYKAITEEDIQQSILDAVGQVLAQIESRPEKLVRLAQDVFSHLQIGLTLSGAKVSLSWHASHERVADRVEMALQALHDYLASKKKHAVIFIDEFQKLVVISKDHAIEAALRHVVQSSQQICYIFAGSNRHLLESMFFDSNRPFFRLCDTLKLQRIEPKHYLPYINHAAIDAWSVELDNAVIDHILSLTHCHSYYVNMLCSILWRNDDAPTCAHVDAAWQHCQMVDKAIIENELDLLSNNQRKVLVATAKLGQLSEPGSERFRRLTGLAATSIAQAVNVLLQKDFLYQDAQGCYYLIDPLMQSLLS